MKIDPRTLALIQQRLDEAERNLQYIRQALEENGSEEGTPVNVDEDSEEETDGQEKIIEGVFDGQNMQGNDGNEYPVPPNYASKSKLVEGDLLKLTIDIDGSFVYKQIQPVDRRRVVGKLVVDEQGNFTVQAEGDEYKILLASVTFYKAEEGDEVTILLPENGEAEWGAVDNVMRG